uniref:Uncharacterized protein n=1 Tax=Anguilla anguilla TaxID=7936 RepID=A0A0E9U6L5_ANGAN
MNMNLETRYCIIAWPDSNVAHINAMEYRYQLCFSQGRPILKVIVCLVTEICIMFQSSITLRIVTSVS